jgi:hypothetical protein
MALLPLPSYVERRVFQRLAVPRNKILKTCHDPPISSVFLSGFAR